MASYSIRDLEKLSGIKAHTIRIWEKRYALLEPERSETNIRTYSDESLKRLLNITTLVDQGIRISKVADMTEEQLHEAVLSLLNEKDSYKVVIDQLIVAMVNVDEQRFEKLISDAILRNGFEVTILDIMYPFLARIGVMWQTGNINPAQEHFISNLIRRKVIVAIDGQMMNVHENPLTFILFLPEGELHEIGLLFYDYLIRKAGHKVIYLGQSVPYDDLIEISKLHQPDYLLMSISPAIPTISGLLERIKKDFPQSKLLVSLLGGADQKFVLPEDVTTIRVNQHFRDLLK